MTSIDPARWAAAGAVLAAYAGICIAILRARLARRAATGNQEQAEWLVAYASQTGSAEYLAQQTVATLRTGALTARSASVETLDQAALQAQQRMLFIVSTYGEGDAPDSAARFAEALATSGATLAHLHYGVLALGDSSYANYCGFGRMLDDTLQARGAQPLFARIDVDRGAASAIEAWQHHLSHLAGTSDAPDWSAPAYGEWRIVGRRLANPGSAGAPVYQLSLTPDGGPLPAWEAGDLVQVSAPAEPGYPREYSIASVRAEGAIDLLVRLHLREDGTHGAASGWLCVDATPGATIALRVRRHRRFRLGENVGLPLILIGNGTGLAGLRAHLKARIGAGETRNWLLFGERNAASDYLYRTEIEQWRRSGALAELDLAFSRDGAGPRYVQHALEAQAERLRAWVAQGAAIYVCGSLDGMAAGVNQVLADILGQDGIDALSAAGRYRRDVY